MMLIWALLLIIIYLEMVKSKKRKKDEPEVDSNYELTADMSKGGHEGRSRGESKSKSKSKGGHEQRRRSVTELSHQDLHHDINLARG